MKTKLHLHSNQITHTAPFTLNFMVSITLNIIPSFTLIKTRSLAINNATSFTQVTIINT